MEISAAREERLGWIGLLKAEGNKYLIFSWIFKVHITPNKKKNWRILPAFSFKMSYDLRESNETSGLHAWLKSTKLTFFRRFWSGGRVDIALSRVTYFEALFLYINSILPAATANQGRRVELLERSV